VVGIDGREADGAEGREAEGAEGRETDGAEGRETEGAEGREADGAEGRDAEGAEGREEPPPLGRPWRWASALSASARIPTKLTNRARLDFGWGMDSSTSGWGTDAIS
jgi:hypothetical protein